MHRVSKIRATAAADEDDVADGDFDGKPPPAGGRKTATPTKRKRAKKDAEPADGAAAGATLADGNAEGPNSIGAQTEAKTEAKPKQKRARRGTAAKKGEATEAADVTAAHATAADGNAEGPNSIGTQTAAKPKQKRAPRRKAAKKEDATEVADEQSGLAGGESTSKDATSDQNAQVEAASANDG